MWLIFVLKEGKHEALADKIANTPTKRGQHILAIALLLILVWFLSLFCWLD